MRSLDTKLLIAHSFIDLVEAGDFKKVSVSDIVLASHKNRKTFYYHFPDRSKLTVWIFRYNLSRNLTEAIPPQYLVYNKAEDKELAPFPYYTFIKEGVRSINGAPFFEQLDRTFNDHKSFYAQALADNAADGLTAYLLRLYTPALKRDIEFILSNRFLNDRNQEFLAEFYTGAFVSYLTKRVQARESQPLASVTGAFGNLIHDSIAEEIGKQQQERML